MATVISKNGLVRPNVDIEGWAGSEESENNMTMTPKERAAENGDDGMLDEQNREALTFCDVLNVVAELAGEARITAQLSRHTSQAHRKLYSRAILAGLASILSDSGLLYGIPFESEYQRTQN